MVPILDTADTLHVGIAVSAAPYSLGSAVERIATGFEFTEGPIWHSGEQHLTFSDIPASRMVRWSETGDTSDFRIPSNMANGNAYDGVGRIVTCEHKTSRVVRAEADGALRVLASHWNGQEFNSPNDVVVSAAGLVYFTDPPFGRLLRQFGGKRPVPQPINGVYRVDDTGVSELVAGDFDLPNGLCFSVDGARLFIADSRRRHIRVFDVAANGSLSGGKVWADVPSDGHAVPDGLKVDSAGNVYCSGAGGIQVFDPLGLHIGSIAVPELVANFAFGGADMKTLFITASRSLYRTQVRVAGLPAF